MMKLSFYGAALLLCSGCAEAEDTNTAQERQPLAKAEVSQINAAIDVIYSPYQSASGQPETAWNRPIYSAKTTTLIKKWLGTLSNDNISDLQSADWLCQCQDWDYSSFNAANRKIQLLTASKSEAKMQLNQGWGGSASIKFIFLNEDNSWKVDDIYTEQYPTGLKKALLKEIG